MCACVYNLIAWFLRVNFAVTACCIVRRLAVPAVGLAHYPLWESERSLLVRPSAQDTWGFPSQDGYTNIKPNHYMRLTNHTGLPHIPSHARLAFNELAQIKALRSLLVFSKVGLFLLGPKIH